jgi:hypothetical protein
MDILEHNTEVLKNVAVEQKYGLVTFQATDLREALFRISRDSKITVTSDLCYHLLIHSGIRLKGFRPEKTLLRHKYKLGIDRINQLIPGAYKAKKAGAQKKGGADET